MVFCVDQLLEVLQIESNWDNKLFNFQEKILEFFLMISVIKINGKNMELLKTVQIRQNSTDFYI